MNQLSELYKYFKELFDTDELINSCRKLNPDAMAQDKELIFPLANVWIDAGSFTNGSTVVFNVTLSVWDIRDKNNELITDQFWGQDNEVDNHNIALAVLNRIWSKMYNDFEQFNITASENPSFEMGSFEGHKLLDGAVLTFDVELPNTTINLCQ
jgi:hypothetical protein